MKNTERLQKYQFENYTIVTNFEKYDDAEEYATENAGEILEVGFTDGADNPAINSDGNLIGSRKTFRVGLAPEYQVLYSDDPKFQEMAEVILEDMKQKENDILPEDWLSDQNIADGDRIIIIKNGEVNTVTTRERIKFLMRGNVYEIAVKVANSEKDEA
jgi:hypothetical protein